jgi:putative ABC transport system permease protein
MSLWHCLTIALNNLRANKLRSALTMLGIIIGVSAVIMMVAILQGMSARITDEFNKLGSNLILVLYDPSRKEKEKATHRIDGFTMNDVRDIQQHCDLIKTLSPELPMGSAVPAKYAGKSIDVSPNGVMPDYQRLRNVKVADGRFIADADADNWAKVCVIGDKVRRDLFDNADPIGKNIEVSGLTLAIIGVAEPKGRTFEGDEDTKIFVPLTTVQKRLLGKEQVGVIYAEPVSLDKMNEAKDQIWHLLMRHYADVPGVKVDSLDNMLNSINAVLAAFTIVLGSIAGLALLVGGIGIMNIMLVSVTERTREIGVRKAIGAKRKDILRQFLIESATLSGIGGLTGVILGTATAYLVGFITTFIPALSNPNSDHKGMTMYVPPWVMIGSFVFSAGVGIFFGIYPAIRASALDPITALRHE